MNYQISIEKNEDGIFVAQDVNLPWKKPVKSELFQPNKTSAIPSNKSLKE